MTVTLVIRMSDGDTYDEVDDLTEDIVELAEEYLNLVVEGDEDPNSVKDIELLRDKLEYWERELESLDENDELHAIAVEEKDDIERQIAEHDQEEERQERVRRRIVERVASEFVAKDRWIEPPVLKAITHELLGDVREEILIDEYRLPSKDLDNESLFKISRNVRATMSHELETDDRISELWESIDGTRQYPIVAVLASSPDLLGPSDIAKEIQDEDRDRRHIGDALGKMMDRQYHPYYKNNGNYTLSLVGEFVWQEFGPNDDIGSEEDVSTDSEEHSPDSELTNFRDN